MNVISHGMNACTFIQNASSKHKTKHSNIFQRYFTSCVKSQTKTIINAKYYLMIHKYNFNTRDYSSEITVKT
jgi:hypothetical protein